MTEIELINQMSSDSCQSEVDEISDEDLEVASDMFNDLINGTFYEKQEAGGYPIKYIN